MTLICWTLVCHYTQNYAYCMLQAHVGSNDGSSIEGRSVCGLLVQAVAACIWPLPADMLATALPAAAAELPLPVCLSAAAAAAGATNHAEQQQQQMTPNKWARQQQQQQQVNTAGRLCWQILAEVLLDVYAQLPADSSTSTEPAATAAAGPGPLVPAAVGDDGSSSHLRGQQTEQQLLSCLSCCCQGEAKLWVCDVCSAAAAQHVALVMKIFYAAGLTSDPALR